MSAEFSIVRLEDADIDLLFDFRKRVMPENTKQGDRRRWQWLYRQNPATGGELPVWVIRTPGRIAGAISAVPVPMRLDGERVRAFFGTDYFVEEGFQGLPALRLLKTLQAHPPIHIGANLSESAARLFAKMGYADLGEALYAASASVHRGDSAGTIEPLKRLALSASRSLARIGWFDTEITWKLPEGYDALWKQVCLSSPMGLEKDATYLRWRYEECPSTDYRFVAFRRHSRLRGLGIVYIDSRTDDHRNTGVILDLIVEQGDDPAQDTR